ncbi:hypothetical protein QAD02_003935 [Eretmocerus hayati]|uniref:Uncharacterized protein n=1 Tax=Eretmocerus hayati TaxID=131215 RepID=A0ACC2NT10_9HYME|nr:hypothetical protein QAD02_003935 [Eretmocerus hayati]
MDCHKIIVDCDSGTDDALALAMLIGAHKRKKVEILAITCTHGNTSIENVITNVFRVLGCCDALDIPVYKGAHSPLLTTENTKIADEKKWHGFDGFGDVCNDKPDTSNLKEEHAVFAMHKITKKFSGKVTLICLAPLTNIALTIKIHSGFIDTVQKLIIMGGNINGVGNTTSHAEFNFYTDPESAQIVIHNAAKKVWLLPWETCLKSKITHEWRNTVFGQIDKPIVKLMNLVDRAVYDPEDEIVKTYTPCDVFVAGIFLRPDIAKDVEMYHIDIELTGTHTRGQVVIDHLRAKDPNAYIIQDLDWDTFKNLLMFAADPNPLNSQILL